LKRQQRFAKARIVLKGQRARILEFVVGPKHAVGPKVVAAALTLIDSSVRRILQEFRDLGLLSASDGLYRATPFGRTLVKKGSVDIKHKFVSISLDGVAPLGVTASGTTQIQAEKPNLHNLSETEKTVEESGSLYGTHRDSMCEVAGRTAEDLDHVEAGNGHDTTTHLSRALSENLTPLTSGRLRYANPRPPHDETARSDRCNREDVQETPKVSQAETTNTSSRQPKHRTLVGKSTDDETQQIRSEISLETFEAKNQRLLIRFANHLREEGYGEKTVGAITRTCELLSGHIKKTFDRANKEDIASFCEYLSTVCENKIQSTAVKVQHLERLYQFIGLAERKNVYGTFLELQKAKKRLAKSNDDPRFTLRPTKEQLQRWRELAKREGTPLNQWIRARVDDSISRSTANNDLFAETPSLDCDTIASKITEILSERLDSLITEKLATCTEGQEEAHDEIVKDRLKQAIFKAKGECKVGSVLSIAELRERIRAEDPLLNKYLYASASNPTSLLKVVLQELSTLDSQLVYNQIDDTVVMQDD
jgi:hypothetical protein